MKKYTIKNIVLKVDKAESCKQCGMDYNEHQMGHPEIRKHLYTHFRNDINEFGTKVGSNPDKYKCVVPPARALLGVSPAALRPAAAPKPAAAPALLQP